MDILENWVVEQGAPCLDAEMDESGYCETQISTEIDGRQYGMTLSTSESNHIFQITFNSPFHVKPDRFNDAFKLLNFMNAFVPQGCFIMRDDGHLFYHTRLFMDLVGLEFSADTIEDLVRDSWQACSNWTGEMAAIAETKLPVDEIIARTRAQM